MIRSKISATDLSIVNVSKETINSYALDYGHRGPDDPEFSREEISSASAGIIGSSIDDDLWYAVQDWVEELCRVAMRRRDQLNNQ